MPERSKVVAVGVDGSADGTAAVKWADSYASLSGAPVRLVAAWTWPTAYAAVIAYEGFTPEADARAILEKAQAELTVPDARIESICREGPAGPALVAASDDAELLVLGCHGHGPITGMLLGSVTNYCVHHASCSVVIVR
jgi:nucleotide-binding universal stress UspA family protein